MKKFKFITVILILCTLLCGSGWGADEDVERVRFKENTDISKDPLVMSSYKSKGHEERVVQYYYNQNGQMIKAVGDTVVGPGVIQYEYGHNGALKECWVYDIEGIPVWGKTYDRSGNLTAMYSAWKDGNHVEMIPVDGNTYKYDSKGRMTEQLHIVEDPEYDSREEEKYLYTYASDESFTVEYIHNRYFNNTSDTYNHYIKHYDQNGKLEKEETFWRYGEQVKCITTYTYDQYGNVQRSDFEEYYYGYDAFELNTYEYKNTYDKKNQLIRSEITGYVLKWDEVNTSKEETGRVVAYTYDSRGNMVKESTKWQDGYTEEKTWSYDAYGNLTKYCEKSGKEVIKEETYEYQKLSKVQW